MTYYIGLFFDSCDGGDEDMAGRKRGLEERSDTEKPRFRSLYHVDRAATIVTHLVVSPEWVGRANRCVVYG